MTSLRANFNEFEFCFSLPKYYSPLFEIPYQVTEKFVNEINFEITDEREKVKWKKSLLFYILVAIVIVVLVITVIGIFPIIILSIQWNSMCEATVESMINKVNILIKKYEAEFKNRGIYIELKFEIEIIGSGKSKMEIKNYYLEVFLGHPKFYTNNTSNFYISDGGNHDTVIEMNNV